MFKELRDKVSRLRYKRDDLDLHTKVFWIQTGEAKKKGSSAQKLFKMNKCDRTKINHEFHDEGKSNKTLVTARYLEHHIHGGQEGF